MGEEPTRDGDDASGPIAPAEKALAPEELVYPTFAFDEGDIEDDGGFDLQQELDRETLASWLEELAGGLRSHDVAVESPDGHVRFGVGTGEVAMSFDPDENHRGTLSLTLDLGARAMFVSDDPDAPAVGARGGRGFIPRSMLTDDEDREYRCYSWIDDPTDP
ncbi:MAG: amphi-Trp domain-containing protein [Halolamina sp.]